jgi:hypothetical protein
VDPEVTIVRAESPEGARSDRVHVRRATARTLGGDIYQYHGDWSGVACDELEKTTGVRRSSRRDAGPT